MSGRFGITPQLRGNSEVKNIIAGPLAGAFNNDGCLSVSKDLVLPLVEDRSPVFYGPTD